MQLEETWWEYKGQVGFETTAGTFSATVKEIKEYCESAGLNKKDHSGAEIPAVDINTYFDDNFDKCAEYYFYNVIQK